MSIEDFDYKEYERRCEACRQKNARYLAAFEEDLEQAGLSEKTVYRHLDNANFYMNTYLLREDALPMEEGCWKADDFFGYFFVCKCLWASPTSIRSTAASLKKFYKSMLKRDMISLESYEHLTRTIKEDMDSWIESCRRFDDLASDDSLDLF